MSQITPSLDSTVTQDRHGPQSPVIRACLKLELEEDSWEDSPAQENMAGECGREARGQDPDSASTPCPLGPDGVAGLALLLRYACLF